MSDDTELAQIMDVVERHWRGAGVQPSARFIIDGYCSLGEEIERLSDELEAKDAIIAELVEACRLAQGALRGHDKEWPYMKALASALSKAKA